MVTFRPNECQYKKQLVFFFHRKTMNTQLTLFARKGTGKGTLEEMRKSLGLLKEEQSADRFGLALRNWAQQNIHPPVKALSLFSGAGGLDIGFHDAGFSIQTMLEKDKRFAETLQANCGYGRYLAESEIICADIREYDPPKVPPVDFILGGPPCQTFSAAGRRAAGVQGTSEERGTLFEEYVRILKKLSPQGFLFENVYGITGAENGTAWNKIRKAFANAGYRIFHRILDAADYGVPQHRERLFIVGTKGQDFLFPSPTHGPDSYGEQHYVTAEEAIKNIPPDEEKALSGLGGRFGDLLKDIPPGLNYSFYTEKMGHPSPVFAWRSKFSDFLYKADPATPIRTLKAQGGQYTGPFHWDNRPFSLDELKRLQTIPDTYKIIGGRQVVIHQIGNSVPPQLARILALSILNQVFGIKLLFELPLLERNRVLGFRKRKRLLTAVYERKAKAAIRGIALKHALPVKPSRRTYVASLSGDFSWHVPARREPGIIVRFVPQRTGWQIYVSRSKSNTSYRLKIAVSPRPKETWGIPVARVVLYIQRAEPDLFTSAWKAFEAEIIRAGIKADLVQLCGYYQYTPAFQGSMSFQGRGAVRKEWKVVQSVVAGIGVGSILSSSDLGRAWNLPASKALHHAVYLRRLGYEVRNSNTNPQIPKEHFLIPYAFPTLTSLSVQLRKTLVADRG